MHGAGDTTVFHPLPGRDVVGIGNWGDEERSREICQFLLRPAEAPRDRSFTVYGVRYPAEDTERLFREGDFCMVHNTSEACAAIEGLLSDESRARQQAERGLKTVLAGQACLHRAQELTAICEEISR